MCLLGRQRLRFTSQVTDPPVVSKPSASLSPFHLPVVPLSSCVSVCLSVFIMVGKEN